MKTLLEAYNYIKEAGAPRPPAAVKPAAPAPVAAKPLGGTSSTGSSSIVPQAQPSQAKIDSSRSLRNPNLPPGTNQTAQKPMPMGGSAPGRQVASTMQAAKSPTMQGRPAGSPTTAINVSRPAAPVSQSPSVNAAIGGIRAGAGRENQTTGMRDAAYGQAPTKTSNVDTATQLQRSKERSSAIAAQKARTGDTAPQPQQGANKVGNTIQSALAAQKSKAGAAARAGTNPTQTPERSDMGALNRFALRMRHTNLAPGGNVRGAGGAGFSMNSGKPTPITNNKPANMPMNANAKIGASKQLNFKQAYAAARKSGQTNFEWNGKKFNTNMKGETSAKRSKVLARNTRRTAGSNARRGSAIMEMVKKIVTEHLAEGKKDAHPSSPFNFNKTSRGKDAHADYNSNFKAGPRVMRRYKSSLTFAEEQEEKPEETETKGKKSEKIDVRPEQETFKSNV